MKKVNNLLLKAFAVFAIFTMVSCSGDDDNNNVDPIIGSWKSLGYYDDDVFYEDDECEYGIVTFNADNTGSIFSHDCDFGDETVSLTWEKLANNKYKVVGDDDTSILNTVFDGDKMTISVEGEEGFSDLFQRQ